MSLLSLKSAAIGTGVVVCAIVQPVTIIGKLVTVAGGSLVSFKLFTKTRQVFNDMYNDYYYRKAGPLKVSPTYRQFTDAYNKIQSHPSFSIYMTEHSLDAVRCSSKLWKQISGTACASGQVLEMQSKINAGSRSVDQLTQVMNIQNVIYLELLQIVSPPKLQLFAEQFSRSSSEASLQKLIQRVESSGILTFRNEKQKVQILVQSNSGFYDPHKGFYAYPTSKEFLSQLKIFLINQYGNNLIV